MSPLARTTLLAVATVLVAGCGREPIPAKPAPPPAPAAAAVPAPPQPVTGEVVWGQAVSGVQAGLSVSLNTFESGQPMDFAVCVRAVGGQENQLLDARWESEWQWVFRDMDKGFAWRAKPTEAVSRVGRANLRPTDGTQPVLAFHMSEETWYFDKVTDAKPVKALPPGRYAVTASYEHAEHPQDKPCPFWHGKVVAGPVQIEIKPMPKEVAWGEADNGLRLGLPRPTEPFIAGEPMRMTLLVENVSNQAKLVQRMRPVDFVGHDFAVEIRRQDGAVVPARGECCKTHALDLAIMRPKRAFKLVLDMLSQGCYGVRELAPGKYTVIVRYECTARDKQGPFQLWHGKISSGQVEIEIKSKITPAVSEARAREIALKELAAKHPQTKWKLDKLELAEGRIWRGHAQDAEPKPAMNAAEIGIDAQSGQVTEFRFIPGR
jgi:hypothetical protein